MNQEKKSLKYNGSQVKQQGCQCCRLELGAATSSFHLIKPEDKCACFLVC